MKALNIFNFDLVNFRSLTPLTTSYAQKILLAGKVAEGVGFQLTARSMRYMNRKTLLQRCSAKQINVAASQTLEDWFSPS